ncbi:MAG: 4Fe-4S binding protein [Deltaproteobacteria bacterium]|nr:4Fe-4S binding protein [Deltaproteobacteria bacterium]MBW1951844.1 4Fe-4S binding protein [Deltaproteobacteria bacterium]MBW2133733.1 4Fe-4S binding protein [Deltaproteobacteria bacterium]
MKIRRKIIEIDEDLCDGCGQCVPACAEGAIQVIDGKARLVAEKFCDGLGACLGDCPTGALHIVERDAEDFDPEAVEAYLQSTPPAESLACGCPSAQVQTFRPPQPAPSPEAPVGSALSHWPIKIKLVPVKAPFLQGADLLVLADCAGVVYPRLHQELLSGKVVLLGCPKFDDPQEYLDKLTQIFQNADVRSITVAIMEVPCCSGLTGIVEKALAAAGPKVPLEQIVISRQGQVTHRQQLTA